MPEFLRSAAYPILLFCLVGGLWMLGRATAEQNVLPADFAKPQADYERMVDAARETSHHVEAQPLASTDDEPDR